MNKKFKIGIDYGGTKIEGILLDQNGKQIERKRYYQCDLFVINILLIVNQVLYNYFFN